MCVCSSVHRCLCQCECATLRVLAQCFHQDAYPIILFLLNNVINYKITSSRITDTLEFDFVLLIVQQGFITSKLI